MGQLIKTFSDGSFLEYDNGKFDEWCVYYTNAAGLKNPPRDIDYFAQLKELAGKYGTDRVYKDYVSVYEKTTKEVSDSVLLEISKIASSYDDDKNDVDVILSILYMAMISEENKANTRLGRRVKRLGIYTLLIENKSVDYAANFMTGMKWYEIDKLCAARGF